jgi:hypothetical protein
MRYGFVTWPELSTKKGGEPKSAALGRFIRVSRSGGRHSLACAILFARATDPAARTRRFGLIVVAQCTDSDRGRNHVERDSLTTISAGRTAVAIGTTRCIAFGAFTRRSSRTIVASDAFSALRAVFAHGTFWAILARSTVRSRWPIITGAAFIAILALRPIWRFGALGPFVIARAALLLLHQRPIVVARLQHVVVVILVAVIVAALAALLIKPRAALAEDAIIMVGILEVIFGLHPVAGELRIARHALVFFQKLGGVAALAIVLAIAIRPAGNVTRRLSSTTAAAVALLSIVDQILILMPQAPDLPGPDTASTEAADLLSRRAAAWRLAPAAPVVAAAPYALERTISSGVSDWERSAIW